MMDGLCEGIRGYYQKHRERANHQNKEQKRAEVAKKRTLKGLDKVERF